MDYERAHRLESVKSLVVGDRDVDSLEVGVEHMTAQNSQDLTNWRATDVEGVSGDVSVIDRARASAMPEPHDADIREEDLDADDTYIDDGVVAPAVNIVGEDDTYFFV
ncbi:hypothetical protein BRADI_2g27866v3 [Brachypodium distachyon]|uniref:Uncharacterized protein n=1 Tax=Brachypodium distachyon TaxID=15368 RepID=A0A0Q3MQY2_BRADI|nr:hypothetical protein BRADI_2g27866v3 [Brachypodium distachyon]